MIRLVALGLLCFAVAINAAPSQKRPVTNFAAEARHMVSHANSAEVFINSDRKTPSGSRIMMFPSGDNITVATSSAGDVFFYMKEQDLVALEEDTSISLLFIFSDAREGGCNSRNVLCPTTYITGRANKLDEKSDEYALGLEAFRRRHALAAYWRNIQVSGHTIYLCKLDISNILFISQRGYQSVKPAEYYAGTDSTEIEEYWI